MEKFIEKYFLSIYNTPDPSKTKEAIVLHIAPMGELKDLVASVPGLGMHVTLNITIVG